MCNVPTTQCLPILFSDINSDGLFNLSPNITWIIEAEFKQWMCLAELCWHRLETCLTSFGRIRVNLCLEIRLENCLERTHRKYVQSRNCLRETVSALCCGTDAHTGWKVNTRNHLLLGFWLVPFPCRSSLVFGVWAWKQMQKDFFFNASRAFGKDSFQF